MNFLDERFWLAVSFILFVYLAYKPVKKAILASLDARIEAIKEKVLEAEKLKNDASLLYEKTKKQIEQISNMREQILKENQKETDALIMVRNKEIEVYLESKKIDALNLITEQKENACRQMQSQLSNKVIELVTLYFNSEKTKSMPDSEIAKRMIKDEH